MGQNTSIIINYFLILSHERSVPFRDKKKSADLKSTLLIFIYACSSASSTGSGTVVEVGSPVSAEYGWNSL